MKERVSVIRGNRPVLLLCPYGQSDLNTGLITETAAKELDCYAVINRGFQAATFVDVNNDYADCNRIDHLKQEVVEEEYLRPAKKIVDKNVNEYNRQNPWYSASIDGLGCLVLIIQGCGDIVHEIADDDVEVIVGYGLGQSVDSLTCRKWRKNMFVDVYRKMSTGGEVYEGRGSGTFAGRETNNMNQYYRKHESNSFVESMQLRYPHSQRGSTEKAVQTGQILAGVILEMLKCTDYPFDVRSRFI